jgi:hypothetical protein
VTLNRKTYTVVGIAPQDCPHEPGVFVPPDAWVPFMMQSELDPGQFGLDPNSFGNNGVRFYGRMKPGVRLRQMEAELTVLDDQFAAKFFDPKAQRFPWQSTSKVGSHSSRGGRGR